VNPLHPARLAGHVLVDQLAVHGVELAFGVPGESFLAVLDAFHARSDHLRFITCRQEGGAATMAEAYGKLTGQPGIAFVTRGPGATNASIGVHTAFQDSSPMILFIGQVGGDFRDREAFQEVDYRKMFAPLAKWVEEIDRAERIPEYVRRAFQIATAGRPGPVVLALPEDMLTRTVAVADAMPWRRVQAAPAPAALADLQTRLEASQRPILLVGGGGWNAAAVADLRTFAEWFHLPVATSFRCQDLFDNSHPQFVGDVGIGINPKLAARIRAADLILVIGARLGEMTTNGYQLIAAPRPLQALIHIHAAGEELGRVYEADLAIQSSPPEVVAALARLAPGRPPAWLGEVASARADYLANLEPQPMPGTVQLGEIVRWLSKTLPPDAILTNGAGNYTGWVHRHHQHRQFRTQLAPTSGAMGYGVPAAIAAKLTYPERAVIAFAGDGCFLMNGQELATAMQYGAAIIVIVINNGMYGTIRMHQEREYPARESGTALRNPDFVALARAYGAHAERVAHTAEFMPAFERARACGLPALIELRIPPEAITSRATLSNLRAAALAPRG
jgi:acetolactate synthase-1/2/3 large subunit